MIELEDFWEEIMQSDLQNDEYWKKKLMDYKCKIHLALMVEPYLSLILEGKKTIESRFSKNKVVPYGKVSVGDIVVLKKSGGSITALFEVGNVQFIEIKSVTDMEEIRETYGDALCLQEDFWINKQDSRYVTLITIKHLQKVVPININQKNRKSWIVYTKEKGEMSKEKEEGKVVCVVGKIASGKTTIASELASLLNGEQFSVSDYLKYCLGEKGIDNPTRMQLQEFGETCIANGWEMFCEDFLQYIHYDKKKVYVIDGIRHKDFFEILCKKIYPINPVLIYLEVNENILEKRINDRQENRYSQKRLAEGDLRDLYKLANYIVDASDRNIDDVVLIIMHFLEQDVYTKKIGDDVTNIQYLKMMLDEFNRKRNWNAYHNVMNLAMSISIESAELLEIFQWSDKVDADMKARKSCNEHLKEELADIFIYCLNLANAYNIDISSCIVDKIKKNSKKYPTK